MCEAKQEKSTLLHALLATVIVNPLSTSNNSEDIILNERKTNNHNYIHFCIGCKFFLAFIFIYRFLRSNTPSWEVYKQRSVYTKIGHAIIT